MFVCRLHFEAGQTGVLAVIDYAGDGVGHASMACRRLHHLGVVFCGNWCEDRRYTWNTNDRTPNTADEP